MTSKKLNFQSFAGKAIKSGSATTAVALTILLTTASVWAQSTAPAMEGSTAAPMTAKDLTAAFTKSDLNKDGKLTKTEAEGVPGLAAKFEAIDTDGDKMISKAEFEKAIQ
jgi:EF hand